jgi:hypothetical protein
VTFVVVINAVNTSQLPGDGVIVAWAKRADASNTLFFAVRNSPTSPLAALMYVNMTQNATVSTLDLEMTFNSPNPSANARSEYVISCYSNAILSGN